MISLPRILLVEDDPLMVKTLQLCLDDAGYRLLISRSGDEGLKIALSQKPDLVILDVGLPRLSGLDVCRELRRVHFASPILMLTARHLVEDRIVGLNAGADDYLPKPFELREFMARVQALLRRHEREDPRRQFMAWGDVQVDFAKKTVTKAGLPVDLTKTEFALLDLLGQNAGETVSRDTILDVVWGYTHFPTTRTIDTHIWRLRKKLGDDPEHPHWLKQIHGQGYCLETPDAKAPEAG